MSKARHAAPAGRSAAPGDAAQKQREAAKLRRGYLDLLARIVLILLAAYLVFTFVFLVTQAHGMDMFPALRDGDLVLAFRLQRDFQKNDVVVYTADGVRRIGRVAARGTDVVEIDGEGALRVNGTLQAGEILYPTLARPGAEYPQRVPEGCLYILGDYRAAARDSRDFGPVPLERVEGKVITLLRRRGI